MCIKSKKVIEEKGEEKDEAFHRALSLPQMPSLTCRENRAPGHSVSPDRNEGAPLPQQWREAREMYWLTYQAHLSAGNQVSPKGITKKRSKKKSNSLNKATVATRAFPRYCGAFQTLTGEITDAWRDLCNSPLLRAGPAGPGHLPVLPTEPLLPWLTPGYKEHLLIAHRRQRVATPTDLLAQSTTKTRLGCLQTLPHVQ